MTEKPTLLLRDPNPAMTSSEIAATTREPRSNTIVSLQSMNLEPGAVFAERFRIVGPVRSGSMGRVYPVEVLDSGERAALKILATGSEDDTERFRREASILKSIDSPRVVRFIDAGTAPGAGAFMVMAWLDGVTLEERLQAGVLTVSDALAVSQGIVQGLEVVHAHGVVHRDLKPGNLVLVGGDPERVCIVDFGVAWMRTAPAVTRTGVLVGTPEYMAPEQLDRRAEVDDQTDLFALGIILYECLVGEPPFGGRHLMSIANKLGAAEPESVLARRPDVPASVDALLKQLLQKRPENRPPSASRVAALLSEIRADETASCQPSGADTRVIVPRSVSATGVQHPRRGYEDPTRVPVPHGSPGSAAIGATLGDRIEIRGEIARGGMGIVLEGYDRDVGREIAIKVMRGSDSEVLRSRFILEAQVQGRLDHPNICPVHQLGMDPDGQPYFTMKKVRGRSLSSVLEELRSIEDGDGSGPYSLTRLLNVFVKICDGVAFAHSRGVIHRDLKPANIMIGEYGEVLVMDWGLARVAGDPLEDESNGRSVEPFDRTHLATQYGVVLGTPSYMSPEQARGAVDEIDERSDIYALGGILYAILCLMPPVRTQRGADPVLTALAHEVPPPSKAAPNRAIPRDLEAVAMKALAFAREDRYPSALALRDDVNAYLQGLTVSAARYTTWEILRKRITRHRAVFVTAVIGLLGLLVAAGVAFVNIVSERDVAKRRLAAGFLAQGNARAAMRNWDAALTDYNEARAVLDEVGDSADAVEIAQWAVTRANPPPLMTYRRATGDPAWQSSVLYTPTSNRVLSIGMSQSLMVWDTQTGRLVDSATVTLGNSRHGVDWADGVGRTLLMADPLGPRLWDLETKRETRRFLPEGRARVEGTRISRDFGQVLALTGEPFARGSPHTHVEVWDATTGAPLARLRAQEPELDVAAFAPDGRTIVTGGRFLKLWDASSGEMLRMFGSSPMDVVSVAFSPGGDRILSGSPDGSVRLWRASDGELLGTLDGHEDGVMTVSFSPDGHLALTGGEDNQAKLWDLRSRVELHTFGRPRQRAHGPTDAGEMASFSSDGRLVAVSGSGSVSIWPTDVDRELRQIQVTFDKKFAPLAIHPNGRIAATSDSRGHVSLWDLPTGVKLRTLLGAGAEVLSVRFSPDGHWLAAGTFQRVVIWRVADGDLVHRLSGPPFWVSRLEFSPSATYLYARSDSFDGREYAGLNLWRMDDPPRSLLSQKTPHTALFFSPDERQYLLGLGPRLELRDIEGSKGRRFWTSNQPKDLVWQGVYSSDGRWVLVQAHRRLIMLDASTAGVLKTYEGHTGRIVSFALSPSGRFVASAGADDVRVWDVSSAQELLRVENRDTFSPLQVAWADGEQALVISDSGGFMRIAEFGRVDWYRAFEASLEVAAARIARDPDDRLAIMTLAEWYAFRGMNDWARDLFEKGRRLGSSSQGLAAARVYVELGDDGRAEQEYSLAIENREAPKDYLRICLDGIEHRRLRRQLDLSP